MEKTLIICGAGEIGKEVLKHYENSESIPTIVVLETTNETPEEILSKLNLQGVTIVNPFKDVKLDILDTNSVKNGEIDFLERKPHLKSKLP